MWGRACDKIQCMGEARLQSIIDMVMEGKTPAEVDAKKKRWAEDRVRRENSGEASVKNVMSAIAGIKTDKVEVSKVRPTEKDSREDHRGVDVKCWCQVKELNMGFTVFIEVKSKQEDIEDFLRIHSSVSPQQAYIELANRDRMVLNGKLNADGIRNNFYGQLEAILAAHGYKDIELV